MKRFFKHLFAAHTWAVWASIALEIAILAERDHPFDLDTDEAL